MSANDINYKNLTPLLPWTIWGLAALFYAYEFFLQVSPSVMVPDLMHAFQVNAADLGNLVALYFYAYALMQIPAGVFLDTLGPRKLLTIAALICVIGATLFAYSHELLLAQIGRLLIGIGSSFAAIGAFKLNANWFPLERFAFATGLTASVGMIGAVIGGAPLALLVANIGWRDSMFTLAIIGIFFSIIIWTIVRDQPTNSQIKPSLYTSPQTSLWKSLSYIFKQPQSWLTAIYGGLMFAPTSAFGALWGVPFLMTKYGLDRPIAASAISMIFIGWAVGSPLFGWISDSIRKRKPTLYIGSIGALICMLIVIYAYISLSLLYIFLFLFGVFSAGFLPSFSIIREINPPNINATALGFMNMLNMVGGAILQPLIGWLLDKHWIGNSVDNIRVYSIHSYHMALLSLPLIITLALLLLPFINETHCRQISKGYLRKTSPKVSPFDNNLLYPSG